MAGFKTDNDEDVIADINVTPLVDVVLVLLIIFMVTSSVIKTTAHDIPIPTAANAEEKDSPPPLSVGYKKAVDAAGNTTNMLRLNDKEVTRDELKTLLQAEVEKNRASSTDPEKQKTIVLISASGEFAYQEVVDLIDLARGAGVSAVSLNTKVRPADLPSSEPERDAGSAYAP